VCVFENIISKKIFRRNSYDEKEGENYKMRSLKERHVTCVWRLQNEKIKQE